MTTPRPAYELVVTEPQPDYQYRNADLEVLHTGTPCKNDEEALAYFDLVQTWFPDEEVRFIEKREANGTTYHFMKFEYRDGKVEALV